MTVDIPNGHSKETIECWLHEYMPGKDTRWNVNWYYAHGWKIRFYDDKDAVWFRLIWI